MSLRERMEEHRGLVIAIAVTVLIITVWVSMPRKTTVQPPGMWFWDLTAGKLVEFRPAPDQWPPPITTPDGHELVQANVFACTNCADPADRYIGYLTRYACDSPGSFRAAERHGRAGQPAAARRGAVGFGRQ